MIFLSASNGKVNVDIDEVSVGTTSSASVLARIFEAHGISYNSQIMHSSSVDFAEEEGFAGNSDAHTLIEHALDLNYSSYHC